MRAKFEALRARSSVLAIELTPAWIESAGASAGDAGRQAERLVKEHGISAEDAAF